MSFFLQYHFQCQSCSKHGNCIGNRLVCPIVLNTKYQRTNLPYSVQRMLATWPVLGHASHSPRSRARAPPPVARDWWNNLRNASSSLRQTFQIQQIQIQQTQIQIYSVRMVGCPLQLSLNQGETHRDHVSDTLMCQCEKYMIHIESDTIVAYMAQYIQYICHNFFYWLNMHKNQLYW